MVCISRKYTQKTASSDLGSDRDKAEQPVEQDTVSIINYHSNINIVSKCAF